MASWLLLVQLATTLPLVGLIWLVQVVHYPLFADVGEEQFAHYEALHTRLIGYVVAPLMILEAACATAFLVWRPVEVPESLALLGFGLVLIIWASTFFLQVPQHRILSEGFDPRAHRRLVRTNWIRTVVWTLRGILLLGLLQLA